MSIKVYLYLIKLYRVSCRGCLKNSYSFAYYCSIGEARRPTFSNSESPVVYYCYAFPYSRARIRSRISALFRYSIASFNLSINV